MLFCTFLGQSGLLVKSLCGCICCFFCGGAVLIIVGAVIMNLENVREKDIKEYNAAVTAYEAAGSEATMNSWIPANIDVETTPAALSFAVSAVSDAIEGNLEGITKVGTSYVLKATLSAYATSVKYNFNGASYVSPISINFNTPSKTNIVTAECTSSSGCDTAQMTSYCKGTYGSTAAYSGDDCDETGSCGTCSYVGYLSEVCSVVTAKAPFTLDINSPSCFYPFTTGSHRYESTTSDKAITLMVRKSDDPFLVLQRATRGDNSFGATMEAQRAFGLRFLFAGIGLVVCLCLMIGLMVWCVVRFTQQNPANGAPVADGQQHVLMVPHQGGSVPVMGQPMPMVKQQPDFGNMTGGSPMMAGGAGPYQQPPPPMNPNYGQEMQPMGPQYPQQPPPQYAQGVPPQQPYGAPPPQQQFAQGVPPQGY